MASHSRIFYAIVVLSRKINENVFPEKIAKFKLIKISSMHNTLMYVVHKKATTVTLNKGEHSEMICIFY